MFLSIVIPVYNRKKYIRRCLNSVIEQSFSDFELIVINDGSYDGTEKICDEYANKYKKIKIIHQKNLGVSRARNLAIKYAHGKIITFIDSDDFIPPNYLQAIKVAYDKYGPGFLICTAFKMYTDKGIQYFRFNKNEFYSSINGNGVFDIMKSALLNSVVNKAYDLSLIKKYDIKFPDKINLGEDLIFNLRYLDRMKTFQFLLLNKIYYHGWCMEKDHSLERKWREDFFEIQEMLLHEKINHSNKWIKDEKVYPDISEIYCEWYLNCIKESMSYYFKRANSVGLMLLLKKLLRIWRSEEYIKCKQIYGKEKVSFLKLCCQNYYISGISK